MNIWRSELLRKTMIRKFVRFFSRWVLVGTDMSKYDICTSLNYCTKNQNFQLGMQIHAKIIQYGYEDNMILSSALVDFYAKCCGIEDARRVFDGMKMHDEVSWTSIISGYSQCGCGIESILLFKKMLASDTKPNCFSYVSIIGACAVGEDCLEQGLLVHGHVFKLGFANDSFVISSLIDYYSKCKNVYGAAQIFSKAQSSDIIVYNSMIACYCQNLYIENAIKIFLQMRNQGINLTDFTLSSILHASGSLSVLHFGRQVHGLAIKLCSLANLFVLSSLIDMYSKSGDVDAARHVFDQSFERSNVLWTSIVSGYAQCGRAIEAIKLFDNMVEKGFRPDDICFTAALSACNHAGFLDKAVEYFNKMAMDYDFCPNLDQYACLIDLYARQGNLDKAMELMDVMPFEPNCVMLSSLLSCCKTYGSVELGRKVANQLFALDPHNPAAHLTMAHIYTEAGLWDEAANIRKSMKPKGVEKHAAWSWVEVDEQFRCS